MRNRVYEMRRHHANTRGRRNHRSHQGTKEGNQNARGMLNMPTYTVPTHGAKTTNKHDG